jgi:hypothetical protein
MVAPGTQHFTTFTTGKETTAGTSVATTYEWYGDGTGELNIDPMIALHRGNRGTRTHLAHGTSKGEAVQITYNSDPDIGAAYDELHKIYGQLDGGNAGAGAGTDKTWTIAPSQTGANAQESYTIEVADDIQAWEVAYCQARSFTLGASFDSMTNLSVDWFGRAAVKVTQTAVAANQAVRIPGYLWIPKFAASQAGIAGAGTSLNMLRSWQAEYQTGLMPRFYQDGLTYFGQSVESAEQTVKLSFDLDATATAVAEYDKFKAQTVTFMQLAATGPVISGSAVPYSVTLQFALLYTDVKVLASEEDGVNQYHFEAESVIDPTWATNTSAVIVNSLATIT